MLFRSLEIAASAFNILDPDALPIETGALNRGDGEAERWYWKGTIKASAGIVLSKSAEANFGSQLFFNTAVHPLKLIAVVIGNAKFVVHLVTLSDRKCDTPCVASDHQLYLGSPSRGLPGLRADPK